MLGQRRRRWSYIKTTLCECPCFLGGDAVWLLHNAGVVSTRSDTVTIAYHSSHLIDTSLVVSCPPPPCDALPHQMSPTSGYQGERIRLAV